MATMDARWILKDSQSLEAGAANALRVKVDSGGAIERTASGLNLKAGGVTNAMLAGSIAFDKLADATNIARLDQAENVAATWNFGSNLPVVSADPTTANQLARKAYVDSVASGLLPLQACKLVATTNLSLSGNSGTIDSVSYTSGDRILATGQTDPIQNGVYVVPVTSIPWSRATDLAAGAHAAGALVAITAGTTYGGSTWVCGSATDADVVGTDPLSFYLFQAASSVQAGDGLSKVGQTMSTNPGNGLENNGGYIRAKCAASGGLEAVAGGLQIKSASVAYAMIAAAAIGTGSSQIAAGDHNHGLSGNNKYFGTNGSGVVGTYDLPTSGGGMNVDTFTITAEQASTSKYITLDTAPASPGSTILLVRGGPGQFYGVDFVMDGTTPEKLKWDSLGLDGVLAEGDQVTVIYP